MRHKRLKLSALLLMVFGLSGLPAQESVNTSGGNVSGSGGSVSYSLGQVVYTTQTGANGRVAQGVQQPYEISGTTAITGAEGISLSVSAYPNPASDYLTLEVYLPTRFDNAQSKQRSILSMLYLLYNSNGILIETKKLEGNQTSIDMSNLAPATYFLKISDGNRELKTFKVIKN